jgi:hypothetical protein
MLKAAFIVSLFILLDASECDPQKQDARIGLLEADVRQLKAEVAELKEKPPNRSTTTNYGRKVSGRGVLILIRERLAFSSPPTPIGKVRRLNPTAVIARIDLNNIPRCEWIPGRNSKLHRTTTTLL